MSTPIVSIVCNTFNHEQYISDAIEGFLAQKTSFPFEVLIMDDASTDMTPQIVREYQNRYPDVVKAQLLSSNHYSKGLHPGRMNRDRATGKYVALCEGDDYWVDQNKLQKQVDYMEMNPLCTFCFSNGFVLSYEGIADQIIPWSKDSVRKKDQVDFDAGEIELLGYIPTASFLYRRNNEFPSINANAFQGDCFIKLVMTYYGYAHYIDEPLVVYRRTNAEAETRRWSQSPEYYTRVCDSFILLYEEMKTYTHHLYDSVFDYRIVQWEMSKYRAEGDAAALKEAGSLKRLLGLKHMRLSDKVRSYFSCCHPGVVSKVKKRLK